jgi:hypothetical protein
VKQLLISEQLANVILQYLGKRPYAEVAGMIAVIMQLKEPPVVPPPVAEE